MKIHPIAEIFPRMSDEEFAALRTDISDHGIREPVWLWNGQLIDGRHRHQACVDLGIKCPTRNYTGSQSSLVAFVLSLNLKRRHLNESQRAMVAARLATLDSEEKSSPPIGGAEISTADAADMMNVGQRSVERARKVQEQGATALVEAVEKGEVSVGAAAEIAALPKSQQKRLVAQGAVAEKAAEIRQSKRPQKPGEVERLTEENKELRRDLTELAKQQEPLQDEVEFLRRIENEGDKLKAACAEVKRLQGIVRSQEERITGLMNEKNEAIKEAKSAKARVAKLEKELARVAA